MAQNLYITAVGIHSERVAGVRALTDAVAAGRSPVAAGGRYSRMTARLDPRLMPFVSREDRSILTDISISVLNALADAHPPPCALWSEDHQDLLIYGATDALEFDLTPLVTLALKNGTSEATIQRLGDLKGLVNPLSMLRHLSTNTTYHVSKLLRARGGGCPTRSMSLSGISALEDAALELGDSSAAPCAVVFASGNMRGFDHVLVFDKLGLFDARGGQPGIDPSYGSAALFLERRSERPPEPLAELLAVDTGFAPLSFGTAESWQKHLESARRHGCAPDVIVTYANNPAGVDAAESEALEKVFPGIPTRNYKKLFGYTGKANNLLDLAAALVDPSVAPGSVVLIDGQGFGFGLGTLLVRKLGFPRGAQRAEVRS